MALGMKSWLAVVGIGLALVAISTLPPSGIDAPRRERTPERARYDEIGSEMRRAHDVLLARRWADSLSALAIRTAEDGLALVLPTSVQSQPAALRWRTRVRSAHDALESRDPQLIVGVFWQPIRFGAVPDTPTDMTSRLTIVGTRDGVPYCLQVLTYIGNGNGFDVRWLGSAPPGDAVGACRAYAEHGLPGPQIQSWLKAGGIGFATRDSNRSTIDRLAANGPEARRLGLQWSSDAPMFGRRRHVLFDANAQVQGCLAGEAEACTRAVTDPELIGPESGNRAYTVDHSSVVGLGFYDVQAPFRLANATLLADLEREFGPAAFDRFWTSDQSVPAAFQSAFGMDMGEWLVTWVEPRIGLYRAGPGVPLGALPLSFVTFMALGAVATLAQHRRRVS